MKQFADNPYKSMTSHWQSILRNVIPCEFVGSATIIESENSDLTQEPLIVNAVEQVSAASTTTRKDNALDHLHEDLLISGLPSKLFSTSWPLAR